MTIRAILHGIRDGSFIGAVILTIALHPLAIAFAVLGLLTTFAMQEREG